MLIPLAHLLLQIPYDNSTKAKDRLRQRKKKRFREVLSARIDLKTPNNHNSSITAGTNPAKIRVINT